MRQQHPRVENDKYAAQLPIVDCSKPAKITDLFVSFAGSLPPSPADSGVSDVDSSSSGHTSTDELKARLNPSGLGPHSPLGYHPSQQQFLTPYHYPPGHGQPHRSHMQHHYPVRPQRKFYSFCHSAALLSRLNVLVFAKQT